MSRRGRWVVGTAAVVAVAGASVGILALTGAASHIPILNQILKPSTCPLTGVKPKSGKVPDRPALAIKVENLPEARPQAGLGKADVVYEEPVEGGITRFIAIFQCRDATRVGPVRSARFTDAAILPQFGKQTLFGYAGAAPPVENRVRATGLNDVNFDVPKAAGAYTRDPNRSAPHNLYTSTSGLYRAGGTGGGGPNKVFTFSTSVPPTARRATRVHLDFSSTANVFWTWKSKRHLWVRSYDTGPATLESGSVISAANVVVEVSRVVTTNVRDVAGTPSPEVISVGSGKCLVFRDGRVIKGTWSRSRASDPIVYKDAGGHVIALAPGSTWIELLPKKLPIQVSR